MNLKFTENGYFLKSGCSCSDMMWQNHQRLEIRIPDILNLAAGRMELRSSSKLSSLTPQISSPSKIFQVGADHVKVHTLMIIQGVPNVIVALWIQVLIRPKPLPIIQGVPNVIVALRIQVLIRPKLLPIIQGVPNVNVNWKE